MTGDSQALVMLKNDTIGITGLMQGCPGGVQIFPGSRISISGNSILISQMCNQQTGFGAVGVKVGQAPEMIKKAVHSIIGCDISILQAFDVRTEFTHGDMLKVCPGLVISLASFSPKQTPAINKDSVLQAVRQAYVREYDKETTETADFGPYEVKGNKAEFEVFNPGGRAHDKVTTTVGADGNATGASVELIGEQPARRTATLFYRPKVFSHANRRLPPQQLTAMYSLKMTGKRISGWLSAMPKDSYVGGAGILNLMSGNS